MKPAFFTRALTIVATICLAAVNHDRAGSEVFHPINAELANVGTIKSRRDKRADVLGLGDNLILRLCLCGARMRGCANTRFERVRCRGKLTQGEQRDAGQRYEQAD